MKFYVIEKQYELTEMLELYGYATSYDVVRWFMQSPYKNSLIIVEYDCSEKEFIDMFDEICSHDVNTYKLEMKQSLDGKMCAPLYVNQESYYIDDYYGTSYGFVYYSCILPVKYRNGYCIQPWKQHSIWRDIICN